MKEKVLQPKRIKKEVAAASEMRLKASETFSESKKRKEAAGIEGETSEKSVRSHEAVGQTP